MKDVRKKLEAFIEKLPSGLSYQEALYHLYIFNELEKAETDVRAGKLVSHAEAMAEMRSWTNRSNGRAKQSKTSAISTKPTVRIGRRMRLTS